MKNIRFIGFTLSIALVFGISGGENFDSLFKMAIEDSKQAYPSKQRELTPLVPENPNTIWVGNKILMCSLIPQWAIDQFFKPAFKDNNIFITPQGRDMWVTPVPQLKNFIKNYEHTQHISSDPDPLSRAEMLLGLPVKTADYSVVEFLIDPQYLFRPCPDKEIDDLVCEADMRENDPNFDVFQTVNADEEHKKWYLHEKEIKYTGPYAFPMTRLGYTYDYYKQAKSHDPQGLSEFVIKQGVPITIHSITPFNDYV